MGEWNEVTVDQIKADSPNALATGPFGSSISSKFFRPQGVPVIRGGNLSPEISKRLSEHGLVFISESKAGEFNRSVVREGDLIFTCWGTINQVGLIDGKGSYPFYIISNKQMKLTPHQKIADSFFLYYFFSSPQMQEQILSNNIGSSVPGFNLGQLKTIELSLPPLPEQKAIASVLSVLDDKIDLLHRQNKTLEAMAETLFRQWFVEEAREDWEEGCLGDVADNVRDGIHHNKIERDTKYIGLEHIGRKEITLINFGSSNNIQSNKFQFKQGDILFGKLRPYFHKVCFAPFDGVCSTDILVIRERDDIFRNFCLFAFYQADVIEYANYGSEGTRMPRTNWSTLKQYPMRIPSVDKLTEFNLIVNPMLNKISHNIDQIRTLEKLRDTLLPKLMSGDVRVSV